MILHSSFFILHFAKAKVSHPHTLALTAPKLMFHRMKHDLSHDETLPLANSDFVNRTFTNNYPCNNLSVNALRKTSKNGVFSAEGPSRCQHPPLLGVKI